MEGGNTLDKIYKRLYNQYLEAYEFLTGEEYEFVKEEINQPK